MKMPRLPGVIARNRRLIGWVLAIAAVLAWLLLYMLGNLTGGMSRDELSAVAAPVGLHAIYADPSYLPLKLVRAVTFFSFPDHGQTLSRLPNAIFGGLAMLSFAGLVRLWYGTRVAALAGAMFAFGAWTLHVSRLASFDVLYLWALPMLLFSHFLLRKYYRHTAVWFGSVVVWGLLLYIPGLVWFVLVDIWLQRKYVAAGWRHAQAWWRRVLFALLSILWLPLLAVDLARQGSLLTWLGSPAHFGSAGAIARDFAAVPVHLFIRGPEDPQLWLGRLSLLSVFALVLCILGIYFYATHRKSRRSWYMAVLALLGFILVGLGGPVSLSLLVPLLYVAAATGLAYLLSQWLKTFPNNPFARGLGLGLIIFAVALSCVYNYRAYFIAWPHAQEVKATFQYSRHP